MSDNTKDTPMDYKEFEGHTEGPWTVATDEFGHERVGSAYGSYGCLITEANGKFGNIIIADVLPITPDINSGMPNANLLAAAPDLLKENQSLKLELQKQKEEIQRFELERTEMYHKYEKQKELNAELVKIKNLVEDLIEVPHFRNQWETTTEAFESLIKKSSEI